MQPFQPTRGRISGFLFGAGLTGFLGRGLTEITLWLGTAQTSPRPRDGLSYPVVEHGKTYYVSAAGAFLHNIIFVFWLSFALDIHIVSGHK